GTTFTTHTPVPAGFDLFPPDLIKRYLGSYVDQLKISHDELLSMGRANGTKTDQFNMAILAIKGSSHYNGVSKLHGRVTRSMLRDGWPGFLDEEVPVTSITNGVHMRSWIAREIVHLFNRYLGSGWRHDPDDPDSWEGVEHIPNEELWRTHERQKTWLIAFARKRLRQQFIRRGMTSADIESVDGVLNHDVLTIGFARRFATYKRGALLLRDQERFMKLLTNRERPIQLIFAGKAHPKDNGGKELIRQIIHFAQRTDAWNRVLFLEDYDMNVARYLVQGVDVWLNTPRRPMEASGTSGMKVVPNGGLNLSVLDGWWGEAYDPTVGWAIGAGETYDD
ncbi:MAG: glycosyltransferase family 1 protein, partial [Gammaproteobacteria bacterium]|nr:glycosyltransferase family 1 protein [Gammaproteobacteria bacterium]